MRDYGKQFSHVDDIYTGQKQLGWKLEEFLEYCMTAELLSKLELRVSATICQNQDLSVLFKHSTV